MNTRTSTRIAVSGRLPKDFAISRAELRAAVAFFVACSSARVRRPFCSVDVILQDDEFSARVHEAINGAPGPTDVVTQAYDPLPGEGNGIVGEVYVNCDRAHAAAPRRRGWSPAKELLLYVAHGIDHLSGADDLSPRDYARMRRRELGWLAALSSADGK